MQTIDGYLIGKGKLTWNAGERRTDRYGSVWLLAEGDSTTATHRVAETKIPAELLGKPVKLMAEVLETRQSTHIGDLFRGIFPRTPNVGDLIVLGEGRLFAEADKDHENIGLEPLDGRHNDWLNPCSLYDCHEQTIALIAQPIKSD